MVFRKLNLRSNFKFYGLRSWRKRENKATRGCAGADQSSYGAESASGDEIDEPPGKG